MSLYTYIYIYVSLSLSLSLCIHIHIHIQAALRPVLNLNQDVLASAPAVHVGGAQDLRVLAGVQLKCN